MYESFFGLSEKPFSLNPDPGFLYLGRNHSRALSMLEFGLASETGVVVITGEIGSGKTTLVRALLNQLDDSYTVGLITNTHKAFGELIHWVSMAFGLDHEGRDKVALYNQFVEYMIAEYAAGRRVVVIVDEAQNMNADTLEELRVISNINADKDIVMQLVLVGQPELRETLAQPRLKQFVQRISSYFFLKPLDLHETREYIEHRLEKAGAKGRIFDYEAVYLIHQNAEGVPRVINTLCHLACTYAFAEQTRKVTGDIVREVITDRNEHELFGKGTLTVPDDHKQRADEEARYEPAAFLANRPDAEDDDAEPGDPATSVQEAAIYRAPEPTATGPSLFDKIHAHTRQKLEEAERAKSGATASAADEGEAEEASDAEAVLDITSGQEVRFRAEEALDHDETLDDGGGKGMRRRLSKLFSNTK